MVRAGSAGCVCPCPGRCPGTVVELDLQGSRRHHYAGAPMSQAVVSVSAGILLPVLAPAVGAAVVLVTDVAVQHLRRTHYVIALVSLMVGVVATVAGLGMVAGAARQTLCLPGTGQCMYVADSVGSTLQLAALRGARSAISGAMALLTTSLVSFGLLAMSAALWFTATGSGFLTPAAALVAINDPARRPILVLAVVVVIAGIGFKLSLAPFHAWTPEAYDGAPLPIAAFLAGVSKIAALAALLVVIRAIAPLGAPALISIAIVAAASMTLGNIMALRQNGVVRLLAWSTVAQAGWVVMPLATVTSGAVFASGAYLLAYVLATLLVFAVVAALVQTRGAARARDLSGYHALVHDHPVLAAALGLALLSLAGLPPGVLGLVAKVTALRPVVAGELWWLAVIAAVNAVLSVAVYLRWLRVVMATAEPDTDVTASVAAPALSAHPATLVAVGLAAVALVVTSMNPQLILGLLGS